MAWPAAEIKAQFPVTNRMLSVTRGKSRQLTFLDHGASTHAPQVVLDAVMNLHTDSYANVHRGHHRLSQESSDWFDDAMSTMARFVGANPETQPAVLMSNTTQALDFAAHLVAHEPGKTITTMMEHHSNDLPHRRRGEVLHAEVDEFGRLDLDDLEAKLTRNDVKLVAVTGASNVTAYLPPIHKVARMAHDNGAKILVDAAQLIAHAPVDVKAPDHPEHIDMLAAAGHKAYAPFGSSFLVASRELIDGAPPYIPGGGTVKWVTDNDVGFLAGPDRHQGGTPNITGAVAFAAALDFLTSIGLENIREHEKEIVRVAMPRFEELEEKFNVHLLGPRSAEEKGASFTFVAPQASHHDVSMLLDKRHAIATRNGCFCAQPMMMRLLSIDPGKWIPYIERGELLEVPGATRAAFGVYNDVDDAHKLLDGIEDICKRPEKVATAQPHVEIS